MAIVLPNDTRRAWRRGFWLAMSLAVGMLIGALLWRLSPAQRVIAALITTGVTATPGLVRPRLVVLPLRAWNRLARLFGRAATTWLTGVCFYIVVRAAGGMGSSLRLSHAAAGESLWTPWQHAPGEVGGAAEGIVPANALGDGWTGLAAWARRSRNPWVWCLLPFLVILATFETTGDVEAPPPGIYTLY